MITGCIGLGGGDNRMVLFCWLGGACWIITLELLELTVWGLTLCWLLLWELGLL